MIFLENLFQAHHCSSRGLPKEEAGEPRLSFTAFRSID